MRYTYLQALGWLAAYLLLAALPLVLSQLGPTPPPRSFWVECGVGLGFVGLSMMSLQFVLTGRFRSFAAGLGLDNMLQFHRQAGLVSSALVLAHPVVLMLADPELVSFLDPRVNPARAVVLSLTLIAITALVVTTLWRRTFGIPYEWWRAAHGGLALAIVLVAIVHVTLVGHYVDPLWKRLLWVGLSGAALWMLVQGRILRPLRLRRRPWRVVAVRPERGQAFTLTLAPDGHEGLPFAAGQFAWLTIGPSPFSLQQHPFTIASSAARDDRQIEFTIKALGDFTRTVGAIPAGTRAFVEGPFGAFALNDAAEAHGAVFFAAGVGITPVMSMLRTLRDRGDAVPLQVFYANRTLEDALFLEELRVMADEMGHLEVIWVLEEPPEGWHGERGRITGALLDRHKALDDGHRRYYVCGPGPMMDAVESTLVARGIARRRVLSERFDIV